MKKRYTGVLLCGGRSSRSRQNNHRQCAEYSYKLLAPVGTDKAFITIPGAPDEDGQCADAVHVPRPLFFHLLQNAMIPLGRTLDRIVISARNEEQKIRLFNILRDTKLLLEADPGSIDVRKYPEIEVLVDEPQLQNKGPAAGILTAHSSHSTSNLLVLAVDFPQANADALRTLIQGHEAQGDPPVTCFLHPEDGNPEPVMSVWTPVALERLSANALRGKAGPCYTAKQLWREQAAGEGGLSDGRSLVWPAQARWVQDADTPEEWKAMFGTLPAPSVQEVDA